MGWVPPNARGTGGQEAPTTADGAAEQVACVESRREEREDKLGEMKGAQHGGTVRGLGAMNGAKERGNRR